MDNDTDGSDLIRAVLLDDEPGQVFLQAWGGPNTIARALKSIEDEYSSKPEWAAVKAKVTQKTVITSFGQQDTTFTSYIKPNWPGIENREVATSIWGYGARGVVDPADAYLLSADWMRSNVSTVGPLGAEYRVWGDGKQMAAGFDDEDYFGLSGKTADELRAMGYLVWTPPQPQGSWISEGDSSNFALLVENGLRNWEDPSWGGWGGRQAPNPADPVSWSNRGVLDADATGTPRRDWAAARWFSDFQNDLAARMKWSVTPAYADGNHHPVVRIEEGIDLEAAQGQRVSLTVEASDPDEDALRYDWWQYREAGTSAAELSLTRKGADVAFTVPTDAVPGETLHLILEVTDNGKPALSTYKRIVVTVTEAEQPAPSPEPTPSAEPTPSTPPAFDVYTTPGVHDHNGRRWMTTCEPYSGTQRCWTHIWATSVTRTGNGYTQVNGWGFNNLTYLESPRSMWAGNPLAVSGQFEGADGRRWRTECDTAATGRGGCRSYAEATVVEAAPGGGYRTVKKMVFNNIVRFRR